MFCLIPSVRVREGSVFKAVWHLGELAPPDAASDNSQSRCSAWGHLLTGEVEAPFTSPIFEALLDHVPEFFSADCSRAVDQQSLLLECAVDQCRYVCISVTQCIQAVRNASVTHQ